ESGNLERMVKTKAKGVVSQKVRPPAGQRRAISKARSKGETGSATGALYHRPESLPRPSSRPIGSRDPAWEEGRQKATRQSPTRALLEDERSAPRVSQPGRTGRTHSAGEEERRLGKTVSAIRMRRPGGLFVSRP